MIFNRRNIKEFKGKMVRIEYIIVKNKLPYDKKITGVINASGDQHILFKVNNEEPEMSLNYDRIKSIHILKRKINGDQKN